MHCSASCSICQLFIVRLIVTLHIIYYIFFIFVEKKLIDEKATKTLRAIQFQILGLRCCHLFPSFLVAFCLLML